MSDEMPQPLSDEPTSPPVELVATLPPPPPEVVKGKVTKHRHHAYKLEKMQCWPEVLTLLENGESIPRIAAYIQDQRKEYLDASREAVEAALYYWLRKDRATTVGERAPVAHVPLITSSSGQVDPLDGINLLAAIVLDRANIAYVDEKRSGRLSRVTNEAIRLSLDVMRAKAEIEAKRRRYAPPPASAKGPNDVMTQIETMRRVYEQRYGEAAARVILTNESRGRVINALKMVRNSGGEALSRIMDQNVDKADELKKKAEQHAADEAGDAFVAVESAEGA